MKILAVGDIHTKQWIIDEVEKLIPKYDRVIFVGDYADDFGKDGLESIDTWHKLYMLQQVHGDKVKLVLGNHDYIYVNKTPSLQTGYNGVTQLSINSPNYKYLRDWLLGLPIVIEEDGIHFSHAGIAEGWGGEMTVEDLWHDCSPLWVRPSHGSYANVPQVFGHTPSESCWEVAPKIWCIDTFSTYRNGEPIGDQTCLQINNGKYKKVKLCKNT